MISVLINAVHYFLSRVFIVKDSERSYRLVVMIRGKVCVDKSYDSIRGAKIAFTKFYRHQALNSQTLPIWTSFFESDSINPLTRRYSNHREELAVMSLN